LAFKELKLTGNEAKKVAQALSSETGFKILQLVSKEKLDVSTIARRLKLSETRISEEISRLESLRLIKVSYARGKRGIRKICEVAVGR
jgi:predicted transcriptional regulator